ncbi:hypothetical protein J3459_010657 [Metarhizium acridum]|uniref:uncharacterized protein n=1 Tax=Metarhizium acridum TaxID=92637 RepID=UPI001C6B15DC|nr:hypothetical protein J3458_020948 [Metarhizium acridum]KAG8422171.1 hypothetical protein J3459_010657 [Metarhizium acridum]
MSSALRQSTPEQVNINMTRSRKTLSPLQLEHKRAHDREAQRANRRRVKERIARLEQELEEKRGQLGSNRVYQELLRRNRLLEEEVARLKSTLTTSSGAGFSPPGSSSGSVPEGGGFDYDSSTDYSSNDMYRYLIPHFDFPSMTTQLQRCDAVMAKGNHSLPTTLDGIDIGSPTALYKSSSITCHTPETASTNIFHHVDKCAIPAYGVDTPTAKLDGLQNGMHVRSGLWNNTRRHHDEGRSDSRCGLQAQVVAGGWDSNPTHKMNMRSYQGEACFLASSPTWQHFPAYYTGYDMNSH